jgi:ADP-ribosylation factor GTPase-activating protein 2/3
MECAAVHRSLGVHISFIRSTELDFKWTQTQLRMMEAGGNEKARQFFRQHGVLDNTKIDSKYNSRAAELYREKLKGEGTSDTQKKSAFSSIQDKIDSADGGSKPATAPTTSPSEDFDSWAAEAAAPKASPKFAPAAAAPSPAIVKSSPSPTTPAASPSPSPAAAASTAPAARVVQPVSSSDYASSPTLAGSKSTAANPKKGAAAKKATISFDDFDKWDDIPDEAPVVNTAPKTAEEKEAAHSHSSRLAYHDPFQEGKPVSSASSSSSAYQSPYDAPAGAGGSRSQPPSAYKKPSASSGQAEPGYAQKNFAGAKSISSDQYFGRDRAQNDPETQARLAKFSGSRSISSAQYFGREEEEAGGGGDLMNQIASADLSSVAQSVTDGAKKLSDYANSFFSDLQERYG